ncbi:hypothetical protein BCR36DRAFT_586956 [Piromyces finnis]|uniref:SHSP domain-containing protein n=1 Tax=Piromyces finnis TaxID=1754191 RepID=A0A1Y1UX68_9FUNG|nr:hypothetical protein BCR36DRAFT_586956 [Piromyces finnis]|eukprot:ORX42808.1 hypothetical protein BCR36DRAFT_586956 [Piromyces finnis]
MSLFYPYRLIPELLFPNIIFDASDRFLELVEKQIKYDISENDKEYLIEMVVPGFSVFDIIIECEADGTLIIKSKKEENESKEQNIKDKNSENDTKKVNIKSKKYKSFRYSFKFPCLDKVEATFKNEILNIKIEKIKKPSRQITISKL